MFAVPRCSVARPLSGNGRTPDGATGSNENAASATLGTSTISTITTGYHLCRALVHGGNWMQRTQNMQPIRPRNHNKTMSNPETSPKEIRPEQTGDEAGSAGMACSPSSTPGTDAMWGAYYAHKADLADLANLMKKLERERNHSRSAHKRSIALISKIQKERDDAIEKLRSLLSENAKNQTPPPMA